MHPELDTHIQVPQLVLGMCWWMQGTQNLPVCLRASSCRWWTMPWGWPLSANVCRNFNTDYKVPELDQTTSEHTQVNWSRLRQHRNVKEKDIEKKCATNQNRLSAQVWWTQDLSGKELVATVVWTVLCKYGLRPIKTQRDEQLPFPRSILPSTNLPSSHEWTRVRGFLGMPICVIRL